MTNQIIRELISEMIESYLEESYDGEDLLESIFEEVSDETWEAIEEAILNELSPKTLQSYLKKAEPAAVKTGSKYTRMRNKHSKKYGEFEPDTPEMAKIGRQNVNREDGVWRARKKLGNK
jgi:hypothetical protein